MDYRTFIQETEQSLLSHTCARPIIYSKENLLSRCIVTYTSGRCKRCFWRSWGNSILSV